MKEALQKMLEELPRLVYPGQPLQLCRCGETPREMVRLYTEARQSSTWPISRRSRIGWLLSAKDVEFSGRIVPKKSSRLQIKAKRKFNAP